MTTYETLSITLMIISMIVTLLLVIIRENKK